MEASDPIALSALQHWVYCPRQCGLVHPKQAFDYGSINPQLVESTGFSDADPEVLICIFPKLFENDASSERPDGSMEVLSVV